MRRAADASIGSGIARAKARDMKKSSAFDCDVLVVGAGPTGLVAAAQLAERGVSVRIIDAAPIRSDKSRALAVHARSLELLDKMGLAEPLIRVGQRSVKVNMHVKGERVAGVDIENLRIDHTPFPYILFVSQVETERVLDGHLAALGLSIERPVELVDLTQDDDGVAVRVTRNGREETIRARYVIGADGAHSAVRHALKLPFEGAAYEADFILGDVEIDGDFPREQLNIFFAKKGMLILFPMPGGRTRVVATGPGRGDRTDALTTTELSLAELQEQLTRQSSRPDLKACRPVWLTRFHLHHRMVDRYRVGRVFVAGDAAHIHSPAGGQGMNTGMQDSFNLAWKLAMVLEGRAPEGLLDSYDAERRPVGRRLLRVTDRLFDRMSTGNPVVTTVRNFVAPRIMPWVMSGQQGRVFSFVSQTGIRYRRSPVVAQVTKGGGAAFRKGPRAGDRAPGAALPEGHFLSRLRGTGWWLLGFCGRGEAAVEGARLRARLQGARASCPWITPLIVTGAPVSEVDAKDTISDPEGALHRRYGLTGPGIYLVRPDGHTAFRSAGEGIDPLCRWLDDQFPWRADDGRGCALPVASSSPEVTRPFPAPVLAFEAAARDVSRASSA